MRRWGVRFTLQKPSGETVERCLRFPYPERPTREQVLALALRDARRHGATVFGIGEPMAAHVAFRSGVARSILELKRINAEFQIVCQELAS